MIQEMTLKNGKKKYRASLSYRDPYTKKVKSLRSSYTSNKSDALKQEKSLRNEAKKLKDPDIFDIFQDSKQTLSQYFDRWYPQYAKRRNMEFATVQGYFDTSRTLSNGKLQYLGSTKLNKLTVALIEFEINKLGNNSAQKRLSHIRGALRDAFNHRLLNSNIGDDLILSKKTIRGKEKPHESFSIDEINVLIDYLYSFDINNYIESMWVVALMTSLVTGLRPQEFRALTWGDLKVNDFGEYVFDINKAVNHPKAKQKTKTTKINAEWYTLPLPDWFVKKLTVYRSIQNKFKDEFLIETDLMFFSGMSYLQYSTIEPAGTKGLYKHIRPLLKELDIKSPNSNSEVVFYHFRDTFITFKLHLYPNRLSEIAEATGHDTVTTLNSYLKPLQQSLGELSPLAQETFKYNKWDFKTSL